MRRLLPIFCFLILFVCLSFPVFATSYNDIPTFNISYEYQAMNGSYDGVAYPVADGVAYNSPSNVSHSGGGTFLIRFPYPSMYVGFDETPTIQHISSIIVHVGYVQRGNSRSYSNGYIQLANQGNSAVSGSSFSVSPLFSNFASYGNGMYYISDTFRDDLFEFGNGNNIVLKYDYAIFSFAMSGSDVVITNSSLPDGVPVFSGTIAYNISYTDWSAYYASVYSKRTLDLVTDLDSDISYISSDIGQLNSALFASSSSIMQALGDIQTNLNNSVNVDYSQVLASIDNYCSMISQYSTYINQNFDALLANDGFLSNLPFIKADLDTIVSALTSMQSSLSSIDSKLTTANSTLSTISSRVNTTNTRLNTINTTLTGIRGVADSISSQLTTANENILAIRNSNAAIASDTASIDSTSQTISQQMTTNNNNTLAIRNSNAQIASDTASIDSNLQDIVDHITSKDSLGEDVSSSVSSSDISNVSQTLSSGSQSVQSLVNEVGALIDDSSGGGYFGFVSAVLPMVLNIGDGSIKKFWIAGIVVAILLAIVGIVLSLRRSSDD